MCTLSGGTSAVQEWIEDAESFPKHPGSPSDSSNSASCDQNGARSRDLVELSVLRPYEGLDVAAISPKPAFTSGGHPGLAVSAIHSFER